MNTRRQQRGIGMKGLVIFLIIGGFFLWIFFKLFVPVTSYLKVRATMDNVIAQPEITKKSSAEIMRLIFNRLAIDDIEFIDNRNYKEFVTITRKEGKVIIHIKHQTEVPLFNGVMGQDILLLVRFDQTAESS